MGAGEAAPRGLVECVHDQRAPTQTPTQCRATTRRGRRRARGTGTSYGGSVDVLTRNNVTLSGRPDGRPMVFAHGFGCDQGMWRHVAPAFDARPTGSSSSTTSAPAARTSRRTRRPGYGRLDGYATDVTEILDALDLAAGGLRRALGQRHDRRAGRRSSGPSCSSGWSWSVPAPGTSTTRATAAASPRPRSTSCSRRWTATTWAGRQHIAPVIMGAPERPELGRRAGQQLLPHRPGDRPPLRPHHLPVRQPRRPRPGAHARRWCVQCRARRRSRRGRWATTCTQHLRDSELVLLDATGHCPNLSAPDQVVAAMRRYLAAA